MSASPLIAVELMTLSDGRNGTSPVHKAELFCMSNDIGSLTEILKVPLRNRGCRRTVQEYHEHAEGCRLLAEKLTVRSDEEAVLMMAEAGDGVANERGAQLKEL